MARNRVLSTLGQRWKRLAGVALCAGILAGLWGYANAPCSATVVLAHDANSWFVASSPTSTVAGVELDFTPGLLLSQLDSPALLRQAAAAAGVAAEFLQPGTHPAVSCVAASNLIFLTAHAATPEQASSLANAFGDRAVRLGEELQTAERKRLSLVLRENLAALDRELERASRDLISLRDDGLEGRLDQDTAGILRQIAELGQQSESLRAALETADQQLAALGQEISRFNPARVNARESLERALLRYTREHPKVKELEAALDALEGEIARRPAETNVDVSAWGNPGAAMLYAQLVELRNRRMELSRQEAAVEAKRQQLQAALQALPGHGAKAQNALARYQTLREEQRHMAARQQSLELVAGTASGAYHLLRPAAPDEAAERGKWQAAIRYGSLAGLGGLLAAGLLCAGNAVSGRRIRTAEDLRCVTGLPVLAVLGDVYKMNDRERDEWAFRTLTAFRGRLTGSSREALVCGFISSRHGEGRSTWVRLIADAARSQGYQVATVDAARPPGAPAACQTAQWRPEPDEERDLLPAPAGSVGPWQLAGRPGAHHLPQWQWTLEKCDQWECMLEQCRTVDRLILLVDLPPASFKEAILLAQGIPHLIWVAKGDMADASETRSHLDLLRQARCRLAGTVLNHAPSGSSPRCFLPWFVTAVMLLFNSLTWGYASAEAVATAPTREAISDSSAASRASKLADWQQRLTLGPGDVLDISLYGQTDSLRNALIIGPDGRLNYLEARDVTATGLTIDELRARLEEALGKFHRSPRVVITPVAYNSKKYYLLGSVQQVGAYSLSRPVHILEAIARAGGFVTSYQHRNALVQADLGRSFLVRSGAGGTTNRVPVDFEALLLRGDLTQNQALAPGDYLYFPPIDLQEVYVLGAVASPGVVPYGKDMTTIGAIVARGGFAEKAYRSKVLVVRGSLTAPQRIVVDANAILTAREKDFPLQNKDIVFVSRRPFAKVEELAEQAVTSFVNGMIWGFTQNRIIPNLPY